MEHKDGIDRYNWFVSLHKVQLESSGIPDKYWLTLYKKLESQIFDAGNTFSMFKIDYEADNKLPEDALYTVLVTNEDGVKCGDSSQIYLIDHAWTYKSNKAVSNLIQINSLLNRMCNLMGLPLDDSTATKIEKVCKEMWRYNQTYSQAFGEIENRIPVWYIMDEFGSAIEHSNEPNFRVVPFFFFKDQTTYSLLFPIKDVSFRERVTRDFLEGSLYKDEITRKALMIPWQPSSFLDVSFEQAEPEEKYFLSEYIKECLAVNQRPFECDKSKVFKVYTEYDLIKNFLTHPSFEIVENKEEADILWLTSHFKDYKSFNETSPEKFINQFPCEGVMTIKNLFSVICRRKKINNLDRYADNPPWHPTTYDLNEELVKFVSYYQHREKEGLDNLWICKPWNLARGLDTTITDNIYCIVRLPSSGPKIAQKYLSRPILFRRDDVGLVKFDVRYVVALKSVSPLQVYAYKNFFLRFANREFDLTDFWNKEKHFTVMNYDEETPLFKMLCDEFVEKFNVQNPQHDWSGVEDKIFRSFREIFEAATSKLPPFGIGHNFQSRAFYAIDLMLALEKDADGLENIQPKILEVNWLPDCERACQYYPTFYNDIFALLFKDECNESIFQML